MNGSRWWTGITIRQAQELGFHRELPVGKALRPGETVGLRRRIWWSLFLSSSSVVFEETLINRLGQRTSHFPLSW